MKKILAFVRSFTGETTNAIDVTGMTKGEVEERNKSALPISKRNDFYTVVFEEQKKVKSFGENRNN